MLERLEEGIFYLECAKLIPRIPNIFLLNPLAPRMEITYTTPTLNISPVRISTVVTTCHVGTGIQLSHLFDHIQTMPYWDLNDGVLKMEFQGKTKGISWKDIMQKNDKKKKESTTYFYNQATIVIRREIAPLQWKEINVKLFQNGGVQMTGIRSEKMCQDAIDWLIAHILSTCPPTIFQGPTAVCKMQIQLVNTDFSIGAKIRREALYKLLNEKYHLTVSYEPSIYQGVKTKYFYNQQRPTSCPLGLCPCEKLCKGTGNGDALGSCKKITISPFQTGQVIITGARTMEQINEAYEFMKELFVTHADDVLRKNYICPESAETPAPTAAAAASSTKSTRSKQSGWIHHPSPRNVMKIARGKIIAE